MIPCFKTHPYNIRLDSAETQKCKIDLKNVTAFIYLISSHFHLGGYKNEFLLKEIFDLVGSCNLLVFELQLFGECCNALLL